MNASIASRAPYRPAARPRPVSAFRALLPAIILFYATIIPMEVRFEIADQTFYPPRVAGFMLLPWILTKLVGGGLRFKPVDSFMFFGVAWMMISFLIYYDPMTGLLRSAPLAFDILVPYLVARICLRDVTDLRRFLLYIVPGLVLAGGSMALESMVRTPIVRPLAADLFGRLALYENGEAVGTANFIKEIRLGFMRATGPFSHPILGGIFLASFLPLYLNAGLRGWPKLAGCIATFCGFFSLSSGAFLVYLIGTGAVIGDRIQKLVSFVDWRKILVGTASLLLFVHLLSKNGIVSILIRYTLDPATGYYRQLIWRFGSASVMKHPLIGIGYTDFERLSFMGTSVDHHWLLIAIRHGIPAFAGVFLSFAFAAFGLMRNASTTTGYDRATYVALAASLGALMIGGLTVAYFGSSLTLFYFFGGLCINMGARVARPRLAVAQPSVTKRG